MEKRGSTNMCVAKELLCSTGSGVCVCVGVCVREREREREL